MRHAIDDQSHSTFENMNDLLLRVRVRRHATPGRQRGDHLIHGLAVCDRTACDAGTNFNCRVFSFHLQNLTVEAAASAAELKNQSRECSLCPCDVGGSTTSLDTRTAAFCLFACVPEADALTSRASVLKCLTYEGNVNSQFAGRDAPRGCSRREEAKTNSQ